MSATATEPSLFASLRTWSPEQDPGEQVVHEVEDVRDGHASVSVGVPPDRGIGVRVGHDPDWRSGFVTVTVTSPGA